MDGRPSKINPTKQSPIKPYSQTSNAGAGFGRKKKSKKASVTPTPTQTEEPTSTQTGSEIEPHHINKAIIAVGVVVLAGLVVWMR